MRTGAAEVRRLATRVGRTIRSLNLGPAVAIGVPSLTIASLVVWVLQDGLGVSNPSVVYLVAVVVTALLTGTAGAILAAIASFLLYDFFFINPRFTLTVAEPGEWLGVIVLLFVGVVVGQLAALQRSRTEVAVAREREARAQFLLSRVLATRASTPAVLPEVIGILATETRMARLWLALGADDASERVAADTAEGQPRPQPGVSLVLRRTPGDSPAEWIRVHQPGPRRGTATSVGSGVPATDLYRIRIMAEDRSYGSIWALRPRGTPRPDRTETRLLSASADLVGVALDRDRLAAENQAAEIARASDALKSALLQSVSHDLRTPLASIRAAAGSLRPGSGLSEDDQRESAAAIDREVEYLNRLVTNLLDLSRIEAGALRAEREVFDLDDLLGPAIERLRTRLGDRTLEVHLDAPPVVVDPILLDEAVANVLDNAVKYTPPGSRLRISAAADGTDRVRLTIDDTGPGVPAETLGRLFEKFYRVPGRERTSRTGTGIGLAVVRGLMEAMDGHVSARASELGGLAIDFDLPQASPVPAGPVPAVAA